MDEPPLDHGPYRFLHQEQLYIENNAMIAVPGEDGGIVIHGSMQCPYYVHKAMKRALAITSVQARVIQEETGGGFGGKEEYPSMIALHAALLALKCHKPVRMIYDRHEDISATTKRHPAVVRSRWGVSDTGELVAQEIEVIMDGGAYCTLTPVVLSRGVLHAGGPYRCENVRITGRAMATNTPPNCSFRVFGARRPVRRGDAGHPHRRGADASPSTCAALFYREGDARHRQVPAKRRRDRVLDRAAEARPSTGRADPPFRGPRRQRARRPVIVPRWLARRRLQGPARSS